MSDMTCREAGRLGGQATSAKYGRAHFARLGAMASPAPEVLRASAALGGAATRDAHGIDHYREIGRRGGLAVLAVFGKDHYREAGRKGGLAAAARKRAQREGGA